MDEREFDAVIDAVRSLVREKVVPRETEIEEKDAVPQDIRQLAAVMGLFGYALPAEYGGLGLGMSQDVRLAFELGYTTPAFRSMFGTNNGVAGQVLVRYGTEEQRREWLPRLAAGECVASFALTEREAGSDPSGLATRAVRGTDGYRVTGIKRLITNAPVADLFVVFARTDPDATGSKGISALLVPAGTPGVVVGPADRKMGQSGSWTAEVAFDDALVPHSALVGGQEGEGFRSAMASIAQGRLHIAAMSVGQAQRALDEMVRYAAETRQGGRAIGGFQLVQAMIGDSQTELYAGRAMTQEAARAFDRGEDQKIGPSAAKLFCTEMLGRVADRAVQVHGGTGYMRGGTVERIFRDARAFRIYEGTSEIQRVVIAKHLLGAHL
jgi:acyl-CoA dehydrogenase